MRIRMHAGDRQVQRDTPGGARRVRERCEIDVEEIESLGKHRVFRQQVKRRERGVARRIEQRVGIGQTDG